jgi:vacuolar-type H+-ATPase subunit F/Vma7
VRDGYRVIFFTEDLLPDLAPLLERHRHDATPCLVPLPVGGSRAGMDRLRDIVRRAVGADVFGDATERSQ